MDINQVIAAAHTTSKPWVGEVRTRFTTHEAILTFATRDTAASVAMTLREAGATSVHLTRSPYGETILTVTWKA